MNPLGEMRDDWDSSLATLSPEKQEYYSNLRNRIRDFKVPCIKDKAIVVELEDLDWFYLACVFKAEQYRLTPYAFEWFEDDLKDLKRRVKNPVRAWYPKAALHMIDTVTNRQMHMRLIEKAGYQYGA